MEINFITQSQDKISSAASAFKNNPHISVIPNSLDVPEIQSLDVCEVASWSAQEACRLLNIPVMKLDCGYYVPALNDFPGALVKFFQKSFSIDDFLKLMESKSDRRVIIRECLAYMEPGQEVKLFTAEVTAQIAISPKGEGTLFDRLIIYPGFDQPQAVCDYNKIVDYWNQNLDHYRQLANYLSGVSQVS